MVNFKDTKGGDIEGQIKNNQIAPQISSKELVQIVAPISSKESFDFIVEDSDNIETITLYYSCSFKRASPNLDTIIDYLNSCRDFDTGELQANHDNELYQYPIPLFYSAIDGEGFEILAWSDEENSVVRTPHTKGDA
jgi:hypothetical protein